MTTLSEPDLVDKGVGAQLGSKGSFQFLVELLGKQAQSNSYFQSTGHGERALPLGPSPPGRQGLGLKVPTL